MASPTVSLTVWLVTGNGVRARRVGSYDLSASPHQDCCTLFEPRDPATHASAGELDDAEAGYDLPALVADCLERAERRNAPS